MGAALDHGLQLHLLLHTIKLILRYDGLMEALIDIGLMPDLSNIDGVAQDIIQTAPALTARGPELIYFALEFAQTSHAFIKIKDALNVGCVLRMGFQRLNFGVGVYLIPPGHSTAHPHTLLFGSRYLIADTLGCDFTLKLGEG